MATYLITGGAGFIGSHLAELLIEQGHRVRIFDNLVTGLRTNVSSVAELVIGDITDSLALTGALHGVDGVFHLAGVSSVQAYLSDWAGSGRVNAYGSFTVFEATARANIPLVYASSAAVYGNPVTLPLTESAPTRPISGYGADKLGNELHAAAMAEALGLNAIGLRFFNVYGPRQRPDSAYSGVITIFLNRWRANEPITVFGDGGQTRDFIYVQDVARALVLAMEKVTAGVTGIVNVCSGHATSILDLVDALSRAVGAPIDVTFAAARLGEIQASLGDPLLATNLLGFQARTTLVSGLVAMVSCDSNDSGKLKTAMPIRVRQETNI